MSGSLEAKPERSGTAAEPGTGPGSYGEIRAQVLDLVRDLRAFRARESRFGARVQSATTLAVATLVAFEAFVLFPGLGGPVFRVYLAIGFVLLAGICLVPLFAPDLARSWRWRSKEGDATGPARPGPPSPGERGPEELLTGLEEGRRLLARTRHLATPTSIALVAVPTILLLSLTTYAFGRVLPDLPSSQPTLALLLLAVLALPLLLGSSWAALQRIRRLERLERSLSDAARRVGELEERFLERF